MSISRETPFCSPTTEHGLEHEHGHEPAHGHGHGDEQGHGIASRSLFHGTVGVPVAKYDPKNASQSAIAAGTFNATKFPSSPAAGMYCAATPVRILPSPAVTFRLTGRSASSRSAVSIGGRITEMCSESTF